MKLVPFITFLNLRPQLTCLVLLLEKVLVPSYTSLNLRPQLTCLVLLLEKELVPSYTFLKLRPQLTCVVLLLEKDSSLPTQLTLLFFFTGKDACPPQLQLQPRSHLTWVQGRSNSLILMFSWNQTYFSGLHTLLHRSMHTRTALLFILSCPV